MEHVQETVEAYLRYRAIERGARPEPEVYAVDHGRTASGLLRMCEDLASTDRHSESRLMDTYGLNGSVVDGFHIVRAIGRGGMGVVYEAIQLSLRRAVALKVPDSRIASDESLRRRFAREALTIARLGHGSIVNIFGVGSIELEHLELPYYAMELIEGAPASVIQEIVRELGRVVDGRLLGDIITERRHRSRSAWTPRPRLGVVGRWDNGFWDRPLQSIVLRVAIQTADALADAHANGCIHRDVNPANILIKPDGTVILTDFGLVRDESSSEGALTGAQVLGTPGFIAPEWTSRRSTAIGAEADIYSLCATVYSLLTGKYVKEDRHSSLEDPIGADDEEQIGLPELVRVLRRGLSLDPGDRFPTAVGLAKEFRKCLGSFYGDSIRGTVQTSVDAPKRRSSIDPEVVRDEGTLRRCLEARIKGQGDALARISERIVLTKRELDYTPQRPDGVFLLIGPRSHGKRTIAREVSSVLFGDHDAGLVQLDLAGYATPEASQYLLGTEVRRGDLARALSRRTEGVCVLESADQAHASVKTRLARALATGELVDGCGERISLSDYTFFLVVDIDHPLYALRDDDTIEVPDAEAVRDFYRRAAGDRIQNLFHAIDEILPMQAFGTSELEEIAIILLDRWFDLFKQRHGCRIECELSHHALGFLASNGAYPFSGASHIMRNIEQQVAMAFPGSALEHRIELDLEDGRILARAT